MAVDQLEFRVVMGHFATGVTIVTTHDGDGRVSGLTANSVASVSLDPQMVLVCVNRYSDNALLVDASGSFAINILSNQQEAVSRHFARSGGNKFDGVAYRIGQTGAPILKGAIAFLDCAVRHAFGAGDHMIFVGEALEVGVASDGDPLLYFRGGYRSMRE